MKIQANSAEPMDEKEFEVIPVGTYPCRVQSCLEKHGDSGNYWSVQLEIQGGPYDGKFLWDNLFFTPKALNRFFLVFKRLTGMELDRTKDLEVDPNDLVGCKANVSVVHKEYKGKMQAKVDYDGYSPFAESAKDLVEKVFGSDDLPNF